MAQHRAKTGPQHRATRDRPATFAANGATDPNAEPKHRKPAVSLVHPTRSVSTVVAATTAALLATAVVLHDITPDSEEGLEGYGGGNGAPFGVLELDETYRPAPKTAYAGSSQVVFRQIANGRQDPTPGRVNEPDPSPEPPRADVSPTTTKADPNSSPALPPLARLQARVVSQEGYPSGSSAERRSEPAVTALPGAVRPGTIPQTEPVRLPPAKDWVNKVLPEPVKKPTSPKVEVPIAEEYCPPVEPEQKPRVVAKAKEAVTQARETAKRVTPTDTRATVERTVREKAPEAPRVKKPEAPATYNLPEVEDVADVELPEQDAPRLLKAEVDEQVDDVTDEMDTEIVPTETVEKTTKKAEKATEKAERAPEKATEKAQKDVEETKQDVRESAPKPTKEPTKEVQKTEKQATKTVEKVAKEVVPNANAARSVGSRG